MGNYQMENERIQSGMQSGARPEMKSEMKCLDEMALAMAYVPWQYMNQTYDPAKALMAGTIFPELDKKFTGRAGGKR